MGILNKRTPRFVPRIGIIGGGFGGITMAVRLKQAGFHDFVIMEQLNGPGGTWYANDYPGSEVDVHSTIYRLAFKDHVWTRTHARQPELLDYIEETVDEYGLRDHFRFNTPVTTVRWDDAQRHYEVTTEDGTIETYHVVISAVGLLSDPKDIAWEGLDTFTGEVFHSSRWRRDIDLTGKKVAVVGTGSTSVQIIPAIADQVERLYVYQREPGWVLPKGDHTFTPEEIRQHRSKFFRQREWLKLMAKREWSFTYQPVYLANSKRNKVGEKVALDYLDRMFADRPDLKEALTPDYVFSGKPPCSDR